MQSGNEKFHANDIQSVYTAGYLVNCHLSIHTHQIFKTLFWSYEAKVLSLVLYTTLIAEPDFPSRRK